MLMFPDSLLIQFHTVKLYLCQLSLFDRSRNRTHPWTQFQLRSLCCGLVEAKTLLNFYTSLPLRAEMTFINSQWIQIGFALTFTSKLAVTSLENSIYHQTAEYRDSLDMSSILRKVILRIQALTTPHIDSRGDRDVFYHYEKRLKHLQWWYESNASKPLPASSRLSVTPVPESSTGFFNIPSTVGIESSQDNMSWPPFAAEGVDDMLADWIPDPSAAFDSFW